MAEELEIKEQAEVSSPEVEKKAGKEFKKSKPDFKKKKFTKERVESEFDKRTIAVRRVTKVVKGGKKMHFSVTMIVGDKKGRVGIGSGKAADVTMANDKAFQNAKKHLINVPIVNSTIPHEVWGKFGKSSVLLMPAPEGTGVDAGGSVRAMADMAGIKNIVSKSYGSRNKINVIYATLNGFLSLKTKEQVAALRGKAVEEI
ncbi:MAG TPA: 30S ribosomal protein S5 [Clostridiales bacterium]|nr:30S ribosomal protein S5 [Clostridiales bacterium]